MTKRHVLFMTWTLILLISVSGFPKEPYRVGTTAAPFLEIGIGSSGIALGDAYVASVQDMSAIYWNPAGLAMLKSSEVLFMYQPWFFPLAGMEISSFLQSLCFITSNKPILFLPTAPLLP